MSSTCVVADHGDGGVGVGSDDGDSAVARGGEGEHAAVVLKQDDALEGGLQGEVLVGRRADVSRAQVTEGLPGGVAVEHAQPHLDRHGVGEGVVHQQLAHLPLPHGPFGVLGQERPTVQIQAYSDETDALAQQDPICLPCLGTISTYHVAGSRPPTRRSLPALMAKAAASSGVEV